MKEYKFGFVVVTRNRPEALRKYISEMSQLLQKELCSICIVDGSDDINNIESCYPDSIIYVHCPELSFSERTIKGINLCNAEYICVTGDTRYLDFSSFMNNLVFFDEGYDLIQLSGRDKKAIKEKHYTSIESFFSDNAWDCTLFGTVFFRKSSYKIVDEHAFANDNNNNPFPHVLYYFNCFSGSKGFQGIYKATNILKKDEEVKSENWPNKLETFGRKWMECIDYLDSKYDSYKDEVIKDHGRYSHLRIGSTTGFYYLRMNGALTPELVKDYESVFPRLTDVSLISIKRISRMPIVGAKLVYYSKRVIEKVF